MSAAVSYRFHAARDSAPVARWIADRIEGCERGFGRCAAMSVHAGGNIIAGVAFHNYSPECGVMEMSSAAESPRWLSRPVLRAMHRYIFEEAGCQLAVMRVSSKNLRMRRIAERYGYVGYVIPRLRGRDDAEVIYTLSDDAWRKRKIR